MKTADSDRNRLLTAEDVARRLQVVERTVWKWAASDQMPKPVRIGGATRWLEVEIDEWLAKKAEER
jgi:predicted DNA-binding transcriptional regulator AlpA